jgi:hypothetical protein
LIVFYKPNKRQFPAKFSNGFSAMVRALRVGYPSAFYFSPSRRQGRYKTILGDADEYLKQLSEAKRKIILLQ